MPPRQGQSQFISPVSSLKAPCWEASSSVSERVGEEVGGREVGGAVEDAEACWADCRCCCCCRSCSCCCFCRDRAMSSTVGRLVSSVGERG